MDAYLKHTMISNKYSIQTMIIMHLFLMIKHFKHNIYTLQFISPIHASSSIKVCYNSNHITRIKYI